MICPTHDVVPGLRVSVDDIIRDSNDVPKLTQKLSRTVLVMDKNVMWQVMQKMSDDITDKIKWDQFKTR